MKHRGWIAFSGLIWFLIGSSLLYKGLKFLTQAAFNPNSYCEMLTPTFGSAPNSATFLIALAVFIGFIKGRFVLSKTVKRVVVRISSIQMPIRFSQVYAPSYFLIIALMMGMGMALRFFSVPLEIRGFIDIAVGSALINGSLLYFRIAKTTCDTDFSAQSQ